MRPRQPVEGAGLVVQPRGGQSEELDAQTAYVMGYGASVPVWEPEFAQDAAEQEAEVSVGDDRVSEPERPEGRMPTPAKVPRRGAFRKPSA